MRNGCRLLCAVTALTLTTAAGCEAVLGLGDLSPADAGGDADASTRDASTRDASMGDASRDGTTLDGHPSQDAADAGCPIAYVSVGGSDTNSGCSPDAPKATIGAGLLVASAPPGVVPQVRVCGGTYQQQNLTISRALSLHGSYGCATTPWTAPTLNASFIPITFINPAMNTGAEATLTIGAEHPVLEDGGAVPTAPFTVDGLFINGPSVGTSSTVVTIRSSASVTLTHNTLAAGVVPSTVPAAAVYGMQINASAPMVASNKFQITAAANFPAVGVVVNSDGTARSAANLYDNVITSPTGVYTGLAINGLPTAGSIGVAILTSVSFTSAPPPEATVTLAGNIIVAGQGTGQPLTSPGAIGVYVGLHSRANLVGNTITGGMSATVGDAGAEPATAGVYAVGATVGLFGNRIYGGEVTSGVGGPIGVYAASDFAGTTQIGGSTVVMVNNLIHGGFISGNASSVNVHGVDIFQSDAAVIEDNTVFAGQVTTTSTSTGSAYALKLRQVAGAIVRGNILAGIQPMGTVSSEVVVLTSGCESVGALEGNLFINAAQTDAGSGILTGCHAATVNMKTLESEFLEAGTATSHNVLIDRTCNASDLEAGVCAPDCPSTGCLPWLLARWSNGGSDAVTLDGGWALTDAASCMVAATGVGVNLATTDAGPRVTTDLVDAARPIDGSSVGALQHQGSCP